MVPFNLYSKEKSPKVLQWMPLPQIKQTREKKGLPIPHGNPCFLVHDNDSIGGMHNADQCGVSPKAAAVSPAGPIPNKDEEPAPKSELPSSFLTCCISDYQYVDLKWIQYNSCADHLQCFGNWKKLPRDTGTGAAPLCPWL